MWWDAHSHLGFYSDSQLEQIFGQGRLLGLSTWVQGGYDSKDWRRQENLKQQFPNHFRTAYGLHPWALAEMDEETREQEWQTLKTMAPAAHLIGETGLDSYRTTDPETMAVQEEFFIRHLELATDLNKPVVLHMVRAHSQALKILDQHFNGNKGIVHAYSGSPDVAHQYTQRGFLISIGPGVLKKGYRQLKQTVEKLDPKHMVVESDSPHDPENPELEVDLVLRVAREIAVLKKMAPEQVLNQSQKNLLNLGL
ncbi:MAG: TatD family hydrolase [Bdellovibrionaceae bacterium]|nr:TatD family hydrolase [Bdellovibrionales bacterium]MCB9083996.1 TatD family hydrolase [Pseudobdellovibrionaceae bacterium]